MRMLVVFAAAAVLQAAALSAETSDEQLVVKTIAEYHRAFSAAEPEKVVATLGPSYFIADERPANGSKRLSAHFFLTGEKLRAWPKNYLAQVGPHKSASETVSVSIRGDSAVVLTRDSGSNAFRSWRGEETSWFLGRIAGEWKIAGMVIRDFQLPNATPASTADDRAELLRLHQVVLDAHLKSDVELLFRDAAPEGVMANRGVVSKATPDGGRKHLGSYLASTRFSVYRDMVPPVVEVSDDGTLGWVIVQIEAKGDQTTPSGKVERLEFQSAWIELYRKHEGRWLRAGNVSNFKE